MLKRNSKTFEILLIISFVLVYAFLLKKSLWTLPMPSDPTRYIGSVVWKSMCEYFPYLDRVMIPVGVRLVSFFFSKVYIAGMVYIALVNILILTIGILYCFRQSGFWAAVAFGVLLPGSYLMTGYATYVYTDQTLALYTLLAFIFFFQPKTRWLHPVFVAGIFSALALFSKVMGLATVLFFAGYLIFQKKGRDLLGFGGGLICGSIIPLGLTGILFGHQSLIFVFKSIADNFIGNLTFGGPNTNLVSHFDILVSPKTLPVFISLFICVGAYKRVASRRLFLMSIAHILLLSFIYAVSGRRGLIIDNYMYPAFVFAGLGLAVYLGEIFKDAAVGVKQTRGVLFGLLCLAFLMAGFFLAHRFDPTDFFTESAKITLPSVLRWFYTLGPLAVVSLLAGVEYSRSAKVALAFLLLTSLWATAYGGGLGIAKAASDRHRAGFYYKAAPVLSEVGAESFSVYVERWNQYAPILPVPRVAWIYHLFIQEKYPRQYDPAYFSMEKKEEPPSKIQVIDKKQKLFFTRGPLILTDNPLLIKRLFPKTVFVKNIPTDDGQLFVLDISSR